MENLYPFLFIFPTALQIMFAMLIAIFLLSKNKEEKNSISSIIKVIVIVILMVVVIPLLSLMPPLNFLWNATDNTTYSVSLTTTLFSISVFVIPTIVLLIAVLKRKLEMYPAILMIMYIAVITLMSYKEFSYIGTINVFWFIFNGTIPFILILVISWLLLVLVRKKKLGNIYILLVIISCLTLFTAVWKLMIH